MKSLRDLLASFLTALRAFLARAPRAPRPVRGPAHPWLHAHVGRSIPATSEAPPAPIGQTARPSRASLPPSIAALLARAPDVEPEFVRLRPFFGKPPASARIYSPRPPLVLKPEPPASTAVSYAQRAARALDPITEWLVHASPGRRVRA